MMKYFLGIFLSVFLFSNIYAQNTLSAKLSVPNQISGNRDFTITLTIEKPENFRPYTIFTQTFPEGFFVNVKDIPNAVISFRNQILTITWMRITSGKSLKIPINVSYINGLTGTFSFSGKLTYLIHNKKGEYKLKKHYLSVVSERESISRDLNKYEKIYAQFQNVICTRTSKLQKDNSYIIEVNIQNLPAINSFILTEEVSKSFYISETDTQKYKLLNNKRIIQFVNNNYIKINPAVFKYQLIPKNKGDIQKPVIFGKLSFIYEGKIINIPVKSLP